MSTKVLKNKIPWRNRLQKLKSFIGEGIKCSLSYGRILSQTLLGIEQPLAIERQSNEQRNSKEFVLKAERFEQTIQREAESDAEDSTDDENSDDYLAGFDGLEAVFIKNLPSRRNSNQSETDSVHTMETVPSLDKEISDNIEKSDRIEARIEDFDNSVYSESDDTESYHSSLPHFSDFSEEETSEMSDISQESEEDLRYTYFASSSYAESDIDYFD